MQTRGKVPQKCEWVPRQLFMELTPYRGVRHRVVPLSFPLDLSATPLCARHCDTKVTHCRMAHWRTPCGTRSVQVRKLPPVWIYKQHTNSISVRIRHHHIDRQLDASIRGVLHDHFAVDALLVFLAR